MKGEGCGNNIGPEGGGAIENPGLCDFGVAIRVPAGAVDHEFEACIACDEAPADFSEDAASPIYEFNPVDESFLKPADFTLQYDGYEDVAIAWSPSGEVTSEWTVLLLDPVKTHFNSGEPAVRFEFDRFGYLVVIKGP